MTEKKQVNNNDYDLVENMRAGCFGILDACDKVSLHTNSQNRRQIITIRNHIIGFLLVLQG